jgi:hypothetical protein
MHSLSISRSPERLVFAHFLRTGWRVPDSAFALDPEPLEAKFNPYHDPQNGQFTFAPGGTAVSDGVYRPDDGTPSLTLTSGSEPPPGLGDNSGRFRDPMTLDQTFPGLANAPAGAIIAVADPFLDLTGPSNQMTSALSLAYSQNLIAQIQAIDPSYRYASLGFPDTFDGQMREINDLRWDRAAAIYNATGDTGPLQVETLRYLQDRADIEYNNALAAADAGRLPPAPSERMAIGNYIDRAVKSDFRDVLTVRSLSAPTGQAVRVNGREYDSSGDDLSYSIPDARVDDVAFDITLTAKKLTTPQVRRFFNSDFHPRAVVIIRPRQLGADSSYIIKRPRK